MKNRYFLAIAFLLMWIGTVAQTNPNNTPPDKVIQGLDQTIEITDDGFEDQTEEEAEPDVVSNSETSLAEHYQEVYNGIMEKAYERFRNNDYYGFLNQSDEALKYGADAELWFHRGVSFYKVNVKNKAKRAFKKAVRMGHPTASQILLQLF